MPTCPIRRLPKTCITKWGWWSPSVKAATDISEPAALSHVWDYPAGLDMPRRDGPTATKKEAKPWDMGKGSDHSAPIGTLVPTVQIGYSATGLIKLKVNGKVHQTSDLSRMIWNVSETTSCLSHFFYFGPLRPDLHRHAGKRRRLAVWRSSGRHRRRHWHGADENRLTSLPVMSLHVMQPQTGIYVLTLGAPSA